MIRHCLEIIRILVISPEAIMIMATFTGSIYWPEVFEIVGHKFISDNKIWEYIPVIPLGLLAFSVNLAMKIQAPVESTNRELYDWEFYWMLKYRIVVSIIWSGLSVLCSLLIWFFSNTMLPHTIGILFFSSICVSITVAITEISALFSLKEIMTR